MLCGMKRTIPQTIKVSQRALLEQTGLDDLTAIIVTNGGTLRLPIDRKQLERWVLRQLRAEITV